MIQSGQNPPTSRAGPAFPKVPEKADLGQILLKRGVVRKEHLDECLMLQRAMAARDSTSVPRLGELLVQKGYCTLDAIQAALGEQSKKVLFCPGCGHLVNVDLRPDAIGYKCGRCEAPLIEPPPGSSKAAVESSIIVNSRIPIPAEVRDLKDDPARRFGKYVILAEIGRGGIAAVYRAWDTYLNQYVALKRIKPVSPSQIAGSMMRKSRVASLINEAHNAIRLRHPNIVSVYDIGRVDAEYYISMEHLEGRTLLEEIQHARHESRLSPFHDDPRKWLGVLYQVAHALHYAHTRPTPILHCDLKPGNIFISKDGSARILDFGLARSLGEIEVGGGTISGTPSYMSPEQAAGRNEELDARTDVYGLGAVLYELLTGRPPFTGEITDVLRRTIEEMPPAPADFSFAKEPGSAGTSSRKAKMVPPELSALCMRCLSKAPDQRPANALVFAEEISRISAGGKSAMPRSAGPASLPPTGVRDRAPVGRVAVLGWLLLLVLVPASVFAGYFWHGDLERLLGPDRTNDRLASFRPDLASPLDPELRVRVEAVESFRQRLVAALSAKRPPLAELELRGRRVRNLRVSRATPEGVLLIVDGEADAASWVELRPPGIRLLALAVGLQDEPRDRWGLALHALAAGDEVTGRDLLKSLAGTPLAAEAYRLLGTR